MKLSFLSLAIFLIVSYIFPVECQHIKATYYTNDNCTGDIYQTAHYLSSRCTFPKPATCEHVASLNYYYTSECVQEIPNLTLNFMSNFIYSDSLCTGAVKVVTIVPMNVCVKEFGVPYYGITGMTTKTLYFDSKCTSTTFPPLALYPGSCLPGPQMYMTAGTIPSPTPTTLQQYEKVLFYNGTVQGASTCSSGVIGQVYRPVSSCVSANCQQADNSNNNFQKKECTTSLPTSATAGTFQIATYIDQTSCSSSQTVLRLEIYPIDSCSPYSLINNATSDSPQLYIKSDGCNSIRKFNDSSCSQLISQFDLNANLNSCGSNGVKYMCSTYNSGGGGGNNNGGITGANSTRVNSAPTNFHSLNSVNSLLIALIFMIFISILSI